MVPVHFSFLSLPELSYGFFFLYLYAFSAVFFFFFSSCARIVRAAKTKNQPSRAFDNKQENEPTSAIEFLSVVPPGGIDRSKRTTTTDTRHTISWMLSMRASSGLYDRSEENRVELLLRAPLPMASPDDEKRTHTRTHNRGFAFSRI